MDKTEAVGESASSHQLFKISFSITSSLVNLFNDMCDDSKHLYWLNNLASETGNIS